MIEQRVREVAAEILGQYVVVGNKEEGGYLAIGFLIPREELRRVNQEEFTKSAIHTD